MKNFVVFINNLFASHCHLYSVQSQDAKQAKDAAFRLFDTDFAVDDEADWQITAFEVSFSTTPQYVARVDREV